MKELDSQLSKKIADIQVRKYNITLPVEKIQSILKLNFQYSPYYEPDPQNVLKEKAQTKLGRTEAQRRRK